MSLYNLTRAKKAKKVFMCKKCQQVVEIKQALTHFGYHTEHDATGLVRFCGCCDQAFFMQNDESRELMYRRHVYECLSGRPCSGKLFEVMQQWVKTANLLSPFLVNSQRAENVDQKNTAVSGQLSRTSCIAVEPCSLVADKNTEASLISPAEMATTFDGAPMLSGQAQRQYIDKVEAINVENYWKEKKIVK